MATMVSAAVTGADNCESQKTGPALHLQKLQILMKLVSCWVLAK